MAGWARLGRVRPGVVVGHRLVVLPPSCLPPPPMPSSSSGARSSICSPNISSTFSTCWGALKPLLRPSGRRLLWP
eukprot:1796534-Alexandrium_andersonii.AAC.1